MKKINRWFFHSASKITPLSTLGIEEEMRVKISSHLFEFFKGWNDRGKPKKAKEMSLEYTLIATDSPTRQGNAQAKPLLPHM